MALADTLIAKPPPIWGDPAGTLRVGATRVTLDAIVGELMDGAAAEEIAINFPSVRLVDIYAAIGFYLENRDRVDAYLAKREAEADALQQEVERRFPPEGLRARFLARLRPDQRVPGIARLLPVPAARAHKSPAGMAMGVRYT